MNATKHYFSVVLFIFLYKVILTLKSWGEILKREHWDEINRVALSYGVYNAVQGGQVLTFESVDEILKCDHSNESYWAILSCGTIYYAVQGGCNFWVCGWNPKV